MVHMLEEAADQGYVQAQYNLGHLYKNGHGVAQDYSAAMKWFRMAADQGSAEAQYNLGVMYYKGQGVPQNTSEALRWIHKAQVQGYEKAKQGIELIMRKMRETRASQQTNNSSMPPPSASPIPIGTRVKLHGLKAKPQLNGQYGIVVGYVASSGRCTVALEGARGPKTETKMNIKPENLTWK